MTGALLVGRLATYAGVSPTGHIAPVRESPDGVLCKSGGQEIAVPLPEDEMFGPTACSRFLQRRVWIKRSQRSESRVAHCGKLMGGVMTNFLFLWPVRRVWEMRELRRLRRLMPYV